MANVTIKYNTSNISFPPLAVCVGFVRFDYSLGSVLPPSGKTDEPPSSFVFTFYLQQLLHCHLSPVTTIIPMDSIRSLSKHSY